MGSFIRITQSLHTGEVDQQWVIESDILIQCMHTDEVGHGSSAKAVG